MSGPTDLTEQNQGVNYKALGDLFLLAEQKKNTISYDVSVHTIEIYNEQDKRIVRWVQQPSMTAVVALIVILAGSERVDKSEVTRDKLKEAQHINKSLFALGDVISLLRRIHMSLTGTTIPHNCSKTHLGARPRH